MGKYAANRHRLIQKFLIAEDVEIAANRES